MKTVVMPLRVYNASESLVDEFVREFMKDVPGFVCYSVGKITRSCNMFVPENSWEVKLNFDNMLNLRDFRDDEANRKKYTEFCNKHVPGAEFHEIKPGDQAFLAQIV